MRDGSTSELFERLESNVRLYCRHFPEIFSSGRGSWLFTPDGRKFLDLLTGAGALNYGHNEPAIMRRLVDYILGDGVIQSLDFYTTAKADFLDTFERVILKERKLEYKVQFPNTTGANAVEAALKLARKVTGRHTVAAFTNGYHGMSLGALALSSNARARAAAGVPLGNVVFWPYESALGPEVDTIKAIEAALCSLPMAERPAAAIIELVQGDGGLDCVSGRWLQRLAELCRANGVLLIVDDIQAGCGRTGRFFSFEQMGVVPEMVLLSKSLSGFGTPFSLVLMRPDLDVWEPGEHTGTFRGNNLAFVGAKAALDIFWSDNCFESAIQTRAVAFGQTLAQLEAGAPDQLKKKGRGLITGLEFNRAELAAAASQQLFGRNIIAETCGVSGQTLKFLPPLNIEISELNFALQEIRGVVEELCERKEFA
ncbi:MAG TPA: diaminobutyrate--2-oxoglutarate transaminase [Rhizomicrobium sp.]